MEFPLGLINKKSGIDLSNKNDPIFSVEANASRMERISSLEDIDQLKTKKIYDYRFAQYWMFPLVSVLVVLTIRTNSPTRQIQK